MRVLMFYQSILSDWNHGNAHFLRGVAAELLSRGHEVEVYEPMESWSLKNLLIEHGFRPVQELLSEFPWIKANRYELESFDFEAALEGADLVIVHEWNDPELVKRLGDLRKLDPGIKLLFHDTHHRSVTEPHNMASYDLSGYDGVLAFGEAIREVYLSRGWAQNVWTWHEAADTRVFFPVNTGGAKDGDLVWIGNWGDGERTEELREFLIGPATRLGLKSRVYGVRYPEEALDELRGLGIEHGGWLANYNVPHVYSRHRATVHVPRRPYAKALPGIPTIRVFEALACGIPLVCAPWDDCEGLFKPGEDFLVAENGAGMERRLKDLINDEAMRLEISKKGLAAIKARHTCAHRVNELLEICASMSVNGGEVYEKRA